MSPPLDTTKTEYVFDLIILSKNFNKKSDVIVTYKLTVYSENDNKIYVTHNDIKGYVTIGG